MPCDDFKSYGIEADEVKQSWAVIPLIAKEGLNVVTVGCAFGVGVGDRQRCHDAVIGRDRALALILYALVQR